MTPTSPWPSTATRSASSCATTSAKATSALVAKGALNGVHFHSDDLDASFEKLRAADAEIVQEPTDQPWGTRDLAVRDPSANMVRIDQSPA